MEGSEAEEASDGAHQVDDPQESACPKAFRHLPHEIACCFLIFNSQFLTQAALGAVLAPLHIIGDGLGADTKHLPWLIAAYSLTVGVFLIFTGRLGDVFGHKKLFVLGFLWFATCSLLVGLSGFATNLIYFSVWRAMQGIGPAIVLPNGLALLARFYPPGRRKVLIFSLFGATAPSGYVVGATFSSLLAQSLWWPWSQWILAIYCLLIAVVASFLIPNPGPAGIDEIAKTNTTAKGGCLGSKMLQLVLQDRVDLLGTSLGVSALILIVYAWNEGPVLGWGRPEVFVLLIVGFALFFVFLWIETIARFPIVPLSIFVRPGFPGVLACIALGWSTFGIWIYYITQFIQVIQGHSPLAYCARAAPVPIGGFTATMMVAYFESKVPAHYLLTVAMVAFTVGNILLATTPPDQIYWANIFLAFLLTPFGMDISFPAASLIISNSMPPDQQGVAAGVLNAVLNMSVSLGLGVAGTVESQINSTGLDVLKGYRSASYVAIGLGGLGIICSVFFCRVPQSEPAKISDKDGRSKA